MSSTIDIIMGLDSVEVNLCLKDQDLDGLDCDIDWSQYLREDNTLPRLAINDLYFA